MVKNFGGNKSKRGGRKHQKPVRRGIRYIEEEGEIWVFFEKLVDKLGLVAFERAVECFAQGFDLLQGDRSIDDEIAPLAENGHILGQFGR